MVSYDVCMLYLIYYDAIKIYTMVNDQTALQNYLNS